MEKRADDSNRSRGGSDHGRHQTCRVGILNLKMGGPSIRIGPGVFDPTYRRHDCRTHAKEAWLERCEHDVTLVTLGGGQLCQSVQFCMGKMAVRQLTRSGFSDIPSAPPASHELAFGIENNTAHGGSARHHGLPRKAERHRPGSVQNRHGRHSASAPEQTARFDWLRGWHPYVVPDLRCQCPRVFQFLPEGLPMRSSGLVASRGRSLPQRLARFCRGRHRSHAMSGAEIERPARPPSRSQRSTSGTPRWP